MNYYVTREVDTNSVNNSNDSTVFNVKRIQTSNTENKTFSVARVLSPISFQIQIETNGGTCSVDHLDVKTGENYSFPVVTKTEYLVEGWYTDSSFTNQITEDDIVDYNVQKIYVKWADANVLTLTYLDGTSSYLTGSYPTLNWSDIGKTTYSTSTTNIVKAIDKGSSVYSLGTSVFRSVYTLTEASFPSCTSIGSWAFYQCYSLTTASFPRLTSIYCTGYTTAPFYNCYNLLSLYLMNSVVCTLGHSSAFYSTPIAGYTTSTNGVYGSIYVPASLLTAYQSATNWSYFSSRFVGVEEES